jgi:hypothetical protein
MATRWTFEPGGKLTTEFKRVGDMHHQPGEAPRVCGICRAQRVGDMSTPTERNWTAHLVISSEHAGLKPCFKQLEDEIYRVLAVVDEPRHVKEYLAAMRLASVDWLGRHVWKEPRR